MTNVSLKTLNSQPLAVFLVCLVSFAGIPASIADPKGTMTTQGAGLMPRDRPGTLEADSVMIKQIHEVASWMQNYCSSNVAFPEDGEKQMWVKTQLTELVPYNPYQPDSFAKARTGRPVSVPLLGSSPGGAIFSYDPQQNQMIAAAQQKIRIKVNFGMTFNQAQSYLDEPPSNWEAPPGTITIVSNNQGRNNNTPQDMFVVWGAGSNGKPVRDPFTGKTVLVLGRWTQIMRK